MPSGHYMNSYWIMEIRQSHDCLVFIMVIPVPTKTVLILNSPPYSKIPGSAPTPGYGGMQNIRQSGPIKYSSASSGLTAACPSVMAVLDHWQAAPSAWRVLLRSVLSVHSFVYLSTHLMLQQHHMRVMAPQITGNLTVCSIVWWV